MEINLHKQTNNLKNPYIYLAKLVVIIITAVSVAASACTALKEERKSALKESTQDVARDVKTSDYLNQGRIERTRALALIAKTEITPSPPSKEKQTPSVPEGEKEIPDEPSDVTSEEKEEFSLNFDDADLYEVIDVLAKTLQLNYLIDPRVKGTVTIHTTGKISKNELFSVMEHILKINGVTMVKVGNLYKIMPLSDAPTEPISPRLERGLMQSPQPTAGEVLLQIVPLKFISTAEMAKILKPFLTPGGNIYELSMINLLIITDTSSNVRKLLQMVKIFDAQVFEQIKVEIFPIENTSAEDLTLELESIFSAYGLLMKDEKVRVGVKFIPVPRLNSVLTIASNFELLSQAWDWVKKLDQAVELGMGVHVYFVENVKAEELADILNQIYGAEGIKPAAKKEAAKPKTPAALPTAGGGVTIKGEVKVIADKATNALVIVATPEDYKTISQTIRKLDIVPRQVLIEVLIAEVKLTDSTRFGIEWWARVGRGQSGFVTSGRSVTPGDAAATTTTEGEATTTETATGFVPTSPFFFKLSRKHADFLIEAIADESELQILSSPNVLVSNNQEAKFSVSSEIPIVTGEYVSAIATTEQAGGARTFQYRDTGIILGVTPHINSVGLVSLDISQEVSTPREVSVAGTQTFAFDKRQAETSLVVDKGQTVIIGGLIEKRVTRTRSGIPLLKDIPVLGQFFGVTTNNIERTELMVLITPHVVIEREQADRLTGEFKEKVEAIREILKSWHKAPPVEEKPDAKIISPPTEEEIQKPSKSMGKSESRFPPITVQEASQQLSGQPVLIESRVIKTRPHFYQTLPQKTSTENYVSEKMSEAGYQQPRRTVQATPSPQWVVEVASFRNFSDAQELLNRLEGNGLRVYLAKVTVKGQKWHRVTVGSYYKENQAQEMMDSIGLKFGIKDSWLRPIKENDQLLSGRQKQTPSAQWVVEVASFHDLGDAQTLQKRLEGDGLPAYLAEVTVRGQEWHRVTVGSYYKKNQAQEMMDSIGLKFGIKDSWLRPIKEKHSRI